MILNKSDKEKVQEWVKKGALKKEHVYGILMAESSDEMVKALKSFSQIDLAFQHKIICYLYDVTWKVSKNIEDDDTLFNQQEYKLFKIVLMHEGVVTREVCLDFFKTEYIMRKAADNLTSMGIIDSFTIGKNTIYLLNLEFFNEVRSNE